jgi:phenylalanyl-tRNA synthetase beta chain
VIEHVAHTLAGRKAHLSFEPAPPAFPALDPDASAHIRLNGAPLGYMGMASKAAMRHWGLEVPVAMAEVSMAALVALYPPASNAAPLPEFPAIERDLSLVVDEQTQWARCQEVIRAAAPADLLESMDFVGAYRGKPLDAGKKSLTLRLTFRDPQRTLRNEELDQPMSKVMDAARTALSAQIRGIDIP